MELIPLKRKYSNSKDIRNLLSQFGIAKEIANTKNFFSHFSRAELEWYLYDITEFYNKNIIKLHPDKGGDLEQSIILNSNFTELKKRFNNRLNPSLNITNNKRFLTKGNGPVEKKAVIAICNNKEFSFESITSATKSNIFDKPIDDTHIVLCCKGKQKSCGKINGNPVLWKYAQCQNN